MGPEDYRLALSQEIEHIALKGATRATAWDPGLANAMAEAGAAVYEESCLEVLMQDLQAAGGISAQGRETRVLGPGIN